MERLQQGPFLGLLVNLFGRAASALALDRDGLQVTRRGKTVAISLEALTAPPQLKRGLLGTTLRIPAAEGSDLVLRGAGHAEAIAFSQAIREAWTAFNVAALDRESEGFLRIHTAVADLAAPRRYPAASSMDALLAEARALDARLLSRLYPEALSTEAAEKLARVRAFVRAPGPARDKAIAKFVEAELQRWKAFFDTVESKALTDAQRLAVVSDDDATLVLAGAGSGKTSVITAKAAYLVKAGIRQPNEILLLAYAKNAAQEMSERLESRTGVPVAAQTFHSLAYDIIGKVEGSKPALADHATDERAYLALIKEILRDLVRKVASVAQLIIQWFAQFFFEPQTEWDFKSKHEFYSHLREQELRTLQGELVKSYEELLIANWLFENGVEYEYEPLYEHAVEAGGRREYCPDFRLKESGVYIEHFGVRRERGPGGVERLTTAPFVNRQEYLDGMDWKRELHASRGTVLIETFSYERQEGCLLSGLAKKLEPYVTLKPKPVETIFDRVIELKQFDRFSSLIGTFLRKFKGGGYSVGACEAKAKRLKLGDRAKAFLAVFVPVFEEYERRLGGRIDFEDMILRSARYVESGQFRSPFLHILVDEFQDISQSRARLAKALKDQHPDARIYGVGDDWQSIFRFAGADIHLMQHFGREFGGCFDGVPERYAKVELGRTFRSIDQIAFAARDFVLKNPAQIKKTIVPAGIATEPAIRIVEAEKGEEVRTLEADLASLRSRLPAGTSASVLLLGRYTSLKPDMVELERRFPQLRLTFKTIHGSKGLEADHVILLNANSGRQGFPSEMSDDALLSLSSPEEEAYSNAEERRLMYVAMTRARRTLTILTSRSQPSSFVTELREHPLVAAGASTEKTAIVHRCGACGGRLLQARGRDGHGGYHCEHAKLCGNRLPACGACGISIPRRASRSSAAHCDCGVSHPGCPACAEGWLTERRGQYGAFLGCVRYPVCKGKGQLAALAKGGWAARQGRS